MTDLYKILYQQHVIKKLKHQIYEQQQVIEYLQKQLRSKL